MGGAVRSLMGGDSAVLGRVLPGATNDIEVALDRSLETGERVIYCDGLEDYEQGRYALLRFDR